MPGSVITSGPTNDEAPAGRGVGGPPLATQAPEARDDGAGAHRIVGRLRSGWCAAVLNEPRDPAATSSGPLQRRLRERDFRAFASLRRLRGDRGRQASLEISGLVSRAFASVALAPLKREIADEGQSGRRRRKIFLRSLAGAFVFLTPWRNDRLHRPTNVNERSTVRQEARDDHLTASVLARNALKTVTCLYREHDIARIVEGSA